MLSLLLLAQAAAQAPPAAPPPQPQGVETYSPAFFADRHPGNALDMLNRVPGFTLDTGSSVRGYEGAAGNVLIDGQRPSSKSDPLDQILVRIPASEVARIEVIRGGAPGIDMQGKTVLANVVRKKTSGLKGLAEAKNFFIQDGRNTGGLRVDASGGGDGRTWDVSVQARKLSDNDIGGGPGTLIPGSGAPVQPFYINAIGNTQEYSGAGVYETPLLGGQLRLNGRLVSSKYKSDEQDQFFASAPRVETQAFVDLDHKTEIGARFARGFGADTTLEAVALRQTVHSEIDSAFAGAASRSDFTRTSDRSETIARSVVKRRFGPDLSLELGAEGALNRLDSDSGLTLDGQPAALPAADVQVKEKRGEVFAKSVWQPLRQWTVEASLRYEASTITSKGDVTLRKTLRFAKPRLLVTWAPTSTTQLRLRGEREVGQLNFDDFVATAHLSSPGTVFAGNPDLNPEQAWVAEAALEQRFWGSGLVALTARHYDLSDIVDRAPVFDPGGAIFDGPANIGDGRKTEVQLDLTLPTARLGVPRGQLKGSVRKGWTSVTDPTTRSERGISAYEPIQWTLSFSQDVPRWRFTWGVDVTGGIRERSYRYNLVEDFKISTLVMPYLEAHPRNDVTVRLELFNATTNTARDIATAYPGLRGGPGRPDIQVRKQNHLPTGAIIRLRKTFG